MTKDLSCIKLCLPSWVSSVCSEELPLRWVPSCCCCSSHWKYDQILWRTNKQMNGPTDKAILGVGFDWALQNFITQIFELTNSVACSRAVVQLTNLVVNSSTQAQVFSFPTYHPSLSSSSLLFAQDQQSHFCQHQQCLRLWSLIPPPTSTLSNSGDRHVPTLQALVRREPRSLGEQHYYVPPSWKVFLDSQKVLIPCQVEALLGYFETAVQYNKPNPWQNRCKNKMHCFTNSQKPISQHTLFYQ